MLDHVMGIESVNERGAFAWARPLAFGAGLLLILLALLSPIDAGASRSFAFHGLQHIVLATLAPPLIISRPTPLQSLCCSLSLPRRWEKSFRQKSRTRW